MASAKTIILNYPSDVEYDKQFNIDLALISFPDDIYDIKIDITNASRDRMAKIFDDEWKSTYYYLEDKINIPEQSNSSFILKISEAYNGSAGIEVKIKDSKGNAEVFSGYLLHASYNPSETSESIIRLNNPKTKRQEVYKSKIQHIKEYAVYAFALFSALSIIFLLVKMIKLKNRNFLE